MTLLISHLLTAVEGVSGGVTVTGNTTHFELKAPAAKTVELVIFENYADTAGEVLPMSPDGQGIYRFTYPADLTGKYYAYRLQNSDPASQEFPPEKLIADPYSIAVATRNIYDPVAKTLIMKTDFDWGNDQPVKIDPRDLIIYEAHLKDMTADPTSNAGGEGYYQKFIDRQQRGGLAHLIDMGYNAVEFLPLFEFANVEVPFKDPDAPVYNTWNPYEANHWGYMPTFFFAPESQYASDGSDERGVWTGTRGLQVSEFKSLVKALHERGIAVIMDVVYNHISQYDFNPLKQLDKQAYFRHDPDGAYASQSGCGNDLKTENPEMRKMITESVLYWMREYHIDGFRFDLGLLLDWDTIDAVREQAVALNPGVFLTCEPWGGGYDPNGFSDHGWSSWNDQIRNGIKGQNPRDGLGFIFGKWQGNLNHDSFKRFFAGSPRTMGGQYLDPGQSVNYLESHDDNTLGDFIRLGIGKVTEETVITDRTENAKLGPTELALNKLAALSLLVSQGPIMIAEGQEWGRSKVIAKTAVPDPDIGKIDHNSYNKDNETNWLNWDDKKMNASLVEYYKGLISLRKKYAALRRSNPTDIIFLKTAGEFLFAFVLQPPDAGTLAVILNGDPKQSFEVPLPAGTWQVLADGQTANIVDGRRLNGSLQISPTTGIILRKLP